MKTRQALILGAAIALPLVGESAAVADETSPNVIEFETQNRNDAGKVRCGLFKQAGWLPRRGILRLQQRAQLALGAALERRAL